MRISVRSMLASAGLLILVACSDGPIEKNVEDSTEAGSSTALKPVTPGPDATPTKAMVIQRLRELLAALEAKDYDRAAVLWGTPGDERLAVELRRGLPRMIMVGEISARGIEILAEKGQFGTLAEVFPARGSSWAAMIDVPVEECYGLTHDRADVAVHWDGETIRFLRVDDLGKWR